MTTHQESADAGHTPEAVSDNPIAREAAAGADAVRADDAIPTKRRVRSRDGKNIIFRVFSEEHDDISARADEAGLTVSEFIRRIALGHKTQSRFDYDVIEHLIRIHAIQDVAQTGRRRERLFPVVHGSGASTLRPPGH